MSEPFYLVFSYARILTGPIDIVIDGNGLAVHHGYMSMIARDGKPELKTRIFFIGIGCMRRRTYVSDDLMMSLGLGLAWVVNVRRLRYNIITFPYSLPYTKP